LKPIAGGRRGMSGVRTVLIGVGVFFGILFLLGGIYAALNPGALNSNTEQSSSQLSTSTSSLGSSSSSSTRTSSTMSSVSSSSTSESVSSSNQYGVSVVGFAAISSAGMEGGKVVSGYALYVYDGPALVANITIERLSPYPSSSGYNYTTLVKVDITPTQSFSLNGANMTFQGETSPIRSSLSVADFSYQGKYQTSDGRGQVYVYDFGSGFSIHSYRYLLNNQQERVGVLFTIDLNMMKNGTLFSQSRTVLLSLNP
jgi:hypothetical protein